MSVLSRLFLTLFLFFAYTDQSFSQAPWLFSTEHGFCGGTRQVSLQDGSLVLVTLTPGESDARQALWANGADINNCPCPAATPFYKVVGSCTSVEGLSNSAIDGVGALRRLNGSRLVITGGTEKGHKTHDGHNNVDIRAAVDFVGTMLRNFKSTDVFLGPGRNQPSVYFGQQHGVFPNYVFENLSFAECDAADDVNACQNVTDPTQKHWHVNFSPLLNIGDVTLVAETSGNGGTGSVAADGIDALVQSCPLGLQCAFAARLPIGITINAIASPDPVSLLGQWQGVDSVSNLNASLTLTSENFSRTAHAVFIPNLPPSDDTGCWTWNPTLDGSGGWTWICPGKPNPCLGGAMLAASCQRKPPNGCWHWDPTAGTQGAWIYDPSCGGDPTRRDPDPSVSVAGVIAVAGDPNDKQGVQGSGPSHYIAGGEPLRYSILFENIPTASAPAATVTIKDTLNPLTVDLATLKLGVITFGTHSFSLPAVELASLGTYSTNFDLRPTENLGVRVTASLDVTSGLLTWTLASIDLSSGLPPVDSLAGFLAPGEEGNVSFSVTPKSGTATDTQFTNKATIVFDANDPIDTRVWTNTIDNTPPVSQVAALPTREPASGFTLAWSGADVGSGVQDFTIFVSDNGGPFTPFQTNTTATSATFPGQVGHTYGFYSIARDLVGNVEASKTAAEATTQVVLVSDNVPPASSVLTVPAPNGAGWNNSDVIVMLTSADDPGGSGLKQLTYSASGAQAIASTTLAGASASFTLSAEGATTITFFGTDNAGNAETPKTIAIQLDKTPPGITAVRTPAPNANGWNNSDVTVGFTCADDVSGLATGSPPAPTVLSTEGANQFVSGTCQDLAGNSASAAVSGINIDQTPPAVACSVNPNVLWPPDNKLVTVNVSVTMTDTLSGPAGFTLLSVTSNEPDSGQGDINGFVTGTPSVSGQLRAQRLGSGNGRIYTLTYSGLDRAGNPATCTTTVSVPHDEAP